MVSQDSKRCLFFVEMAWAGSAMTLPALLLSCGCDLTAECLPAKEDVRVQPPAAAPFEFGVQSAECGVNLSRAASGNSALRIRKSRAPARAAESPKLSLPGAAPGRLANFQWGRGRQVMHLPCKQAHMGAVPIDSTISPRGTRLKYRVRSHKPF